MATRMQQRRGTAEQWTNADPILAAGEIGFETDTNQFKIGDGVNAWSDLSYFKNLEDLGGSLDDYILVSTKGQANGVAELDNTGKIPSSQIPDLVGLDDEITAAVSAAVSDLVDGAPAALDTLNEIATLIGDGSSIAGTLISNIAQIDTNLNELGTDVQGLTTDVTALQSTVSSHTTVIEGQTSALDSQGEDIADLTTSVNSHINGTTNVHGIADMSLLATQSYAENQASSAQSAAETNAAATADTKIAAHNLDTTSVHGIADTSLLATSSDVSGAVSDHNLETTSVHGIADTSALATTTTVNTAKQDAIDLAAVASENYTDAAVAALTKSSVGLANVDNTSDADKPVSTATQTALDAKASLSGATFTGSVEIDQNLTVDGNLTVNGTTFNASATSITIEDNLVQLAHQNSANTVDLGLVVAYNDGSAKHAGIARDVSDNKWKLFKGVSTEPSTTVAFGEGSLDALAVGALEATTVTPSSGIVFSDGTQVKAGVPSITEFATAISSSATLASGEQDKFVPLTGAVTITLPATGYSTGQSIDFYQASGTGAQFASTNGVVGTPGLKFRTTYSVVTAMKISGGWLVFGDLSA
jgi:Major tropism determinant N-terminal domain